VSVPFNPFKGKEMFDVSLFSRFFFRRLDKNVKKQHEKLIYGRFVCRWNRRR
jgi:hypothetical protein